jgi:hypothetical protein
MNTQTPSNFQDIYSILNQTQLAINNPCVAVTVALTVHFGTKFVTNKALHYDVVIF